MRTLAEQYGCTQCHRTAQLNTVKIVCFMSCDFYHNKKNFFLIITEKRRGLHPSSGRSEAPGGTWREDAKTH